MVRRAVEWLVSVQREDGGWGEDCATFEGAEPGRHDESLPSQTGWALLGLMAAQCREHPAVARGIAYLTATQDAQGEWQEQPYNAVGFPRVFYLRYHGYPAVLPADGAGALPAGWDAATPARSLTDSEPGDASGLTGRTRHCRRARGGSGARAATGSGVDGRHQRSHARGSGPVPPRRWPIAAPARCSASGWPPVWTHRCGPARSCCRMPS